MAQDWNNFSGGGTNIAESDFDIEENLVESTEPVEDTVEEPSPKPKRASKRRTPTNLTRAQVLAVIEVHDTLVVTGEKARDVLAETYRTENNAEDLTVAITTGGKVNPDPVQDVLDLIATGGDNPMVVAATLAGMDKAPRNRIQAIVEILKGEKLNLPTNEFQAIAGLGESIIGLSAISRSTLEEVQTIRGL